MSEHWLESLLEKDARKPVWCMASDNQLETWLWTWLRSCNLLWSKDSFSSECTKGTQTSLMQNTNDPGKSHLNKSLISYIWIRTLNQLWHQNHLTLFTKSEIPRLPNVWMSEYMFHNFYNVISRLKCETAEILHYFALYVWYKGSQEIMYIV